jgi:DNA-binding PadR family transcriptional regulator
MHPFFDRLRGRHAHHPHHHHAGRHGHGRGFGFGFDDQPGFPGRHGHGRGAMGPGRKLGSADLQLLILALLDEQPSHGYELIKAFEARSNGYYAPSPGMVYPALSYLEEAGHASVEAEGAKKRYSLTDEGRAHLAANRATVDALLQQLAWIGQRMAQVQQAMAQPAAGEADPLGGRRGGRGLNPALHEAVHQLRAVLQAQAAAPAEHQQRVVELLQRCIADIRGLRP